MSARGGGRVTELGGIASHTELADIGTKTHTQLEAALTPSHTDLTDIGTKTHPEIDAHMATPLSAHAAATATLELSGSYQDVPGATLSLAAGTWIVIGDFYFETRAAGVIARGVLDVGGATQPALTDLGGGTSLLAGVSQTWRIVLGGTTTVKLRASCWNIVNGRCFGGYTTITAFRTG